MTISISTAVRNAEADGATVLFDVTGRINFYTGTKPAAPATAATGTLLGTLALASDAAQAASLGVATFNAISSDVSADASGTAGWFRIYNTDETAPGSAGTASDARLDGTCSYENGSGDIKFTDSAPGANDGNIFVEGGTVTMSGLSITMPAG